MPAVVGSARWVAAQRARESQRIDRLFLDPLAPALSGDEGIAALKLSEKYNPRHEETANYIAIRTRFFDDVTKRDTTAGGRQIVLPPPAWMHEPIAPPGRTAPRCTKLIIPSCSP